MYLSKTLQATSKESYLLNGKLEKTNEPYALAKITGVKMCENYNLQYNTNYLSLMPPIPMDMVIVMI